MPGSVIPCEKCQRWKVRFCSAKEISRFRPMLESFDWRHEPSKRAFPCPLLFLCAPHASAEDRCLDPTIPSEPMSTKCSPTRWQNTYMCNSYQLTVLTTFTRQTQLVLNLQSPSFGGSAPRGQGHWRAAVPCLALSRTRPELAKLRRCEVILNSSRAPVPPRPLYRSNYVLITLALPCP